MMWILYELLFILGFLLYLPSAVWRRRLPHPGWSMRLGRYPARVHQIVDGKRPIWVHAVSVGEMLAARPLIDALTRAHPESPTVLSTITPGGFSVASKQAGDSGAAIYFPLDLRGCVRRALAAIRPRALLLMESELWPTVIREAHRQGVPIAVINGRVSPRALPRYRIAAPFVHAMWGHVQAFLMQSQADADRLLSLGVPPERVRVTGNLKWDAATRPAPDAVHAIATRAGLDGRAPLIVGGSTHRGEEGAILEGFKHLRTIQPETRLILAPRHLERLAEVEALVRKEGLACVRFSQPVPPMTAWQVGLVDTFGQLPSYYALANIVFIGGSLIPHGGQNPLEAASLGKPVLFGPSMHNFAAIAHELLANRAACEVGGAHELSMLLEELLSDPAAAEAMGRRAQALVEQHRGATQRTLEALTAIL